VADPPLFPPDPAHGGAGQCGPFDCSHGRAEPSGECSSSERDKRAAHCIGASAPGDRVDAQGRRRGDPEQNQKDARASGIGNRRRDHGRTHHNEKSITVLEGTTSGRERGVTLEHEKEALEAKLGTHKECDGYCRKIGKNEGQENCASRQNE
jgi:hypothetical protein